MNKMLLVILLILYTLFSFSQEQVYQTIVPGEIDVNSFVVSPSGNYIMACNQNNVEIREVFSGKLVETLARVNLETIQTIALSPDSTILATGSINGLLSIYSLGSKKFNEVRLPGKKITALEIILPEKMIVAGTYTGEVHFIDSMGNILESVAAHEDVVSSIDICNKNQLMVSGGFDGKINIFRLKKGFTFETIFKKNRVCRDLEISNSCTKLMAAYDNGKVYSWNIKYEDFLEKDQTHKFKTWITGLDFSDKEVSSWAIATAGGYIYTRTWRSEYHLELPEVINHLHLIENDNGFIYIVFNINDKGVYLLPASKMNLKKLEK